MRRRDFVLGAASVAGAFCTGQVRAQTPCPPSLSGATSPDNCPTPTGAGNLSEAAAQLDQGQWMINPIKMNADVSRWDISWQNTTAFWDDMRREIQYMGKPQASAGGLARQGHWIYSEQTDTWRVTSTTVAPNHYGHIWGVTFDHTDDVGDYYYIEQDPEPDAERSVRIMDRSVENGQGSTNSPWTQVAQSSFDLWSPDQANIYQPGIGFHPNLLGSGKPGIYGVAVEQHVYYDKRNETWVKNSVSNSDPYRTRHGCPSIYVPGRDILVFGDGNAANSDYMIIYADDIDNASPEIKAGPITVRGTTGNHGKFVIDPRDDSVIMLLEATGNRVWTSRDGAQTWRLESYEHPFWDEGLSRTFANSQDGGSWTCCSIPRFGCVVGLYTYNPATILWRPG